jgi:thiosulfate/3-mercaptopyruvate sulfurtransferase
MSGMKSGNLFFLLLLAVFVSCQSPQSDVYTFSGPLLTSEDLTYFDNWPDDVIFVDSRAEQQYNDGHIPGAVHIWRGETICNSGLVLPRNSLALLLGHKGIPSDATLVIYDDRGCAEAARLWWILHGSGMRKIYLLNGGLESWKKVRETVSTEPVIRPPVLFEFTLEEDWSLYADYDTVRKAVKTGHTKIIDARSEEECRYAIPGSMCIDYMRSVDQSETGNKEILPIDSLKRLFGKYNLHPEDTIITYCQTDARSAQTTFILTQLLGYKHVKNYDGSWEEWSKRNN